MPDTELPTETENSWTAPYLEGVCRLIRGFPNKFEEIHTEHFGDAILKLDTQEREDDDVEQHWSLETDAIRYGDMDANDLLYSKPWDLLICSDTMRVWGAQLTLKMVYDESYGEIEESERLAIENSMA